jgi:hypothetical protein
MKKITAAAAIALVLITLAVTFVTPLYATDYQREYEIPELEIRLTLPSNYFTVTTNTPQAELDKSGLTDIDVNTLIELNFDSGIYLEGLDFSGVSGGIYAMADPNTEPTASVYVSYYPYEQTEQEHPYSKDTSRLDWIVSYYLNSSVAAELAKAGITYKDAGRFEHDGYEFVKLSYTSPDYYGMGASTAYRGGELSIMCYSSDPIMTALDATFDGVIESLDMCEQKEPFNYTPIIAAVTIAAALALLGFIALTAKRK